MRLFRCRCDRRRRRCRRSKYRDIAGRVEMIGAASRRPVCQRHQHLAIGAELDDMPALVAGVGWWRPSVARTLPSRSVSPCGQMNMPPPKLFHRAFRAELQDGIRLRSHTRRQTAPSSAVHRTTAQHAGRRVDRHLANRAIGLPFGSLAQPLDDAVRIGRHLRQYNGPDPW